MKSLGAVMAILYLTVSVACAGEEKVLASEKDKISYSIGMDIGRNLKRQAIDIDPDLVSQGIRDSFRGGKTLLSEDEKTRILTEFQRDLATKQQEKNREVAASAKKRGEEFLTKNKKNKGVRTTSSGLQYRVLREGTGKSPKGTDSVTVNYRGTLTDGTEFDSSYKRGQPATFKVDGVIKGWTEALQLMKEGAKWELFLSPDLAYGERGAPPVIGPNEVLIFEVELIEVK